MPEETPTVIPVKRSYLPFIIVAVILLTILAIVIGTALYIINSRNQNTPNPPTNSSILPNDIKRELGVTDGKVMLYLVNGDIYASTADGSKEFKITDTKGKVVAMAADTAHNKIAYAVADRSATACGVANKTFAKDLPSKIYQYDLSNQRLTTLVTSDKCNVNESGEYSYSMNMIPLAYSPDGTMLVFENGGTFMLDTRTSMYTLIDKQPFQTAVAATWEGEYLAVNMSAVEYTGTSFFKFDNDKLTLLTTSLKRGELMPGGKVLNISSDGSEGSDVTSYLYDLASGQQQMILKQKGNVGRLVSHQGKLYNILQNGQLYSFESADKQSLVLDFKKDLNVTEPFDFFIELTSPDKDFAVMRRTEAYGSKYDFVVYNVDSKQSKVVFSNINRMDDGVLRERVVWY